MYKCAAKRSYVVISSAVFSKKYLLKARLPNRQCCQKLFHSKQFDIHYAILFSHSVLYKYNIYNQDLKHSSRNLIVGLSVTEMNVEDKKRVYS